MGQQRKSPQPFTGHLQNPFRTGYPAGFQSCLLYTSDAADERSSVDLGGRRIIKKKKNKLHRCTVVRLKRTTSQQQDTQAHKQNDNEKTNHNRQ